jgi:hypothetical protein
MTASVSELGAGDPLPEPGSFRLERVEAWACSNNLRLNPEALGMIRAAADVQQQDLTSFVS